MSEPIGDIPVQISGDWSKLQKDLLDAEVAAKASALKIADAINSVSGTPADSLVDIRTALAGIREEAKGAEVAAFAGSMATLATIAVAVGEGILAVGTAITALVLSEGKAAESTQNLADRLNLSFQDTRKLSEMSEIAGVSIESLARVSMRLADALEDPAGSGKKVGDALRGMGIEASTSGDALLKLLQKLAEIPDATDRISKAHEIMGRGAVQLEPLLRNYTELSAAVDSLGGKLDNEMVKKLLAADDAADKLSISWSHLKESIAIAFAPAVTATVDALTGLLNGPQTGNLEERIVNLRRNIVELEDSANTTASAIERFFQSNLGLKTNQDNIEALKSQERMLVGQREAIARSKEYNDTLDHLAANQQKWASEEKERTEAQKKLTEAWRKQNLEDIAKEEKAEKERQKENEKTNDQFIKAGKDLESQTKKTQSALDKEWTKYITDTQKASGVTNQMKVTFGQLSTITATLKDRLPEPIYNAVVAAADLNASLKLLGITGDQAGNAVTRSIVALDVVLNSNKTSLDQVQAAWSRTNGEIDRLARTNLPEAIHQYDLMIAALQRTGAPLGEIIQLEEKRLAVIINDKAQRGEAATAEIIALEKTKIAMDDLIFKSRGLGDLTVSIFHDFENAWGSLGKGIADNIVDMKSWGDLFSGILKNLEKQILEDLIGYAFAKLKAVLLEHIDLLGGIGKGIGVIFGGGGAAAGTVGDIAGGAAGQAGSIYDSVTGVAGSVGDVAGSASGAAGSTAGAAAGAAGSGAMAIAGLVTGIVSAVSGVIGNFQYMAMNKSLDIIVLHTLQTANDMANLRRDEWDRHAQIIAKYDDMWRTLLNIYDFMGVNLMAPLQVMGVPGLSPAVAGASFDSAGMLSASGASRANVYVNAVDPSAKEVTKALVKGLEQVGIKVR